LFYVVIVTSILLFHSFSDLMLLGVRKASR